MTSHHFSVLKATKHCRKLIYAIFFFHHNFPERETPFYICLLWKISKSPPEDQLDSSNMIELYIYLFLVAPATLPWQDYFCHLPTLYCPCSSQHARPARVKGMDRHAVCSIHMCVCVRMCVHTHIFPQGLCVRLKKWNYLKRCWGKRSRAKKEASLMRPIFSANRFFFCFGLKEEDSPFSAARDELYVLLYGSVVYLSSDRLKLWLAGFFWAKYNLHGLWEKRKFKTDLTTFLLKTRSFNKHGKIEPQI